MRVVPFTLLAISLRFGSAQVTPSLGIASTYGALSYASITNTGPTDITGDIGTAGSSITGFPPGIYTGSKYLASQAITAFQAAENAYSQVAALPGAILLTGNLGGRTLPPGVYKYSTSAQLTGVLVLAGTGSCNDAWYFQVGSTLITSVGSAVVMTGGATGNVFWKVGTSATIGIGTDFVGNILAAVSVTLNAGSSIEGGVFALGASITLNSNTIQPLAICPSVASSSQPSASATTSPAPSTSSPTDISTSSSAAISNSSSGPTATTSSAPTPSSSSVSTAVISSTPFSTTTFSTSSSLGTGGVTSSVIASSVPYSNTSTTPIPTTIISTSSPLGTDGATSSIIASSAPYSNASTIASQTSSNSYNVSSTVVSSVSMNTTSIFSTSSPLGTGGITSSTIASSVPFSNTSTIAPTTISNSYNVSSTVTSSVSTNTTSVSSSIQSVTSSGQLNATSSGLSRSSLSQVSVTSASSSQAVTSTVQLNSTSSRPILSSSSLVSATSTSSSILTASASMKFNSTSSHVPPFANSTSSVLPELSTSATKSSNSSPSATLSISQSASISVTVSQGSITSLLVPTRTSSDGGYITTSPAVSYSVSAPQTVTKSNSSSVQSPAPTSITSTVFATSIYTVTKCPASVIHCPIGSITTEFISLYTTICPASATETGERFTTVSSILAAPTSYATGEEKETTFTFYATKTYILTSCAPTVTNCFARLGSVTTETIALYTTTYFVKPSPTPQLPSGFTVSTVYTTKINTVTKCPSTVPNCPLGSVATEVSVLYTTICPVTQSAVKSVVLSQLISYSPLPVSTPLPASLLPAQTTSTALSISDSIASPAVPSTGASLGTSTPGEWRNASSTSSPTSVRVKGSVSSDRIPQASETSVGIMSNSGVESRGTGGILAVLYALLGLAVIGLLSD
ncbi:hypothetical protein LSUE1_G006190 [Lachnellula suecica]|uniref:Ice-binding protein n=1 Tax=Lachnellula suecica TaxID=602035 RepID=A0A8T9C525_9HELO|nr:hypothetical protein LSUE1_G006190 [Lachnellula suecica]